MVIRQFIVLSLLIILSFGSSSSGSIPRTIAYQGILTDTAGNPRSDGNYVLTFSFYESEAGGAALWTQTDNLYVSQGMFATFLGGKTPFTDNITFDKPYWLGVSVNGATELTPRVPITSVGYCFYALRADTAQYVKAENVHGKVASAHKADTAEVAKATISGSADTAQFAVNANALNGQPGEFYQNATNIVAGKLNDTCLSGNITKLGQTIESGEIVDGAIQRADVATIFKAPYSDTADFARMTSAGKVDSAKYADTAVVAKKVVTSGGTFDVEDTLEFGAANARLSTLTDATHPRLNRINFTLPSLSNGTCLHLSEDSLAGVYGGSLGFVPLHGKTRVMEFGFGIPPYFAGGIRLLGHCWDPSQHSGSEITFHTKPSMSGANYEAIERMRIDHFGNVGIGTSTPTAKLHVNGNIITSGGSNISAEYTPIEDDKVNMWGYLINVGTFYHGSGNKYLYFKRPHSNCVATIYIYWSARVNNRPQGGFTVITMGSYDNEATPIISHMGGDSNPSLISISITEYRVELPHNANLLGQVFVMGENARGMQFKFTD